MAGFSFNAINPQDIEREAQEQRERDARHDMTAHAALMAALKRLFEVETIQLEGRLGDLKLLHEDQTDHSLIVATPGNTLVVTRDHVTYSEEITTMKQALDGAILAFNNPRARTEEITLKGNLRERLLMTIAGQKLGLKLTNPVTEADLDDALRAEYPAILEEAKQLFAGTAAPEQKKTEQKKEAPVVAAVPPVAAAMAAAAAPLNGPANDPVFAEPADVDAQPEHVEPLPFVPGVDDRAIPAPTLAEASAYRDPQSYTLAFDDGLPVLDDIVVMDNNGEDASADATEEETLSAEDRDAIQAGCDHVREFLESAAAPIADLGVEPTPVEQIPTEQDIKEACDSLRESLKGPRRRTTAPDMSPV